MSILFCEADVIWRVLGMLSNLKYVPSFRKSFENQKTCTLILHLIKELIGKIGIAFSGKPCKSKKTHAKSMSILSCEADVIWRVFGRRLLRIMRSLCQDNAKPMPKRVWKFYRVKVGWVSKVVRVNVKSMSRICAVDIKITRSLAEVKPNAKPMSR